MEELAGLIELSKKAPIVKRYDKPSNVLSIIEEFIDSI